MSKLSDSIGSVAEQMIEEKPSLEVRIALGSIFGKTLYSPFAYGKITYLHLQCYQF